MELPGKNARAMLPLLEEMAEISDENAKLRAFAQAVLGDWPDCGTLDGDDIQTLAENHGLLKPTTPCEPCGEGCTCLEYYGADDFARGEVLCYRKTRLLLGSNVQVTGAARLHRAASSDRRERGRPAG